MNGSSLASACLAACMGSVCFAQSVPTNGDAFVNGNAPDQAFGSTNEPLYVHTWGPKELLVRFDTAGLGTEVGGASLHLRLMDLGTSGTIDVYAVTSGWTEDSVTYNSLPTTEGASLSSVTVSPSQVGADVTIDVTSAVRRWADGTLPAEGFLLTTSEPIRALFASKETGVAPALEVSAGAGAGRPEVLDLSMLPVDIDEPGMYVLDRNWSLGTNAGFTGTVLNVNADDVIIDFRGFAITSHHTGFNVEIAGENVTLRNGAVQSGISAFAIRSNARGTVVEDMQIHSYEGMPLTGGLATVRDSVYNGQVGIEVEFNSRVIGNELQCEIRCVHVVGTGTAVRGNRIDTFFGDAVVVAGNGNLVAGNVFDHRFADQIDGVNVSGSGNQLLDNTFLLSSAVSDVIEVGGTANTLDNNVAAPGDGGALASNGIVFTADGNYYGDNRMAATVPFNLGGTVQTDWGGNVGY